jgi:hypothetical protein
MEDPMAKKRTKKPKVTTVLEMPAHDRFVTISTGELFMIGEAIAHAEHEVNVAIYGVDDQHRHARRLAAVAGKTVEDVKTEQAKASYNAATSHAMLVVVRNELAKVREEIARAGKRSGLVLSTRTVVTDSATGSAVL